jgi:hypothetical protein
MIRIWLLSDNAESGYPEILNNVKLPETGRVLPESIGFPASWIWSETVAEKFTVHGSGLRNKIFSPEFAAAETTEPLNSAFAARGLASAE